MRDLAQDHDRHHGARFRRLAGRLHPGAEAVLPDRQPARADRRHEAGAGRRVEGDRQGSAQAREMAGREPRRRLLHGLCRRRQPALLPADRARARQRQFRPGHRHDQGPRRTRARLRRSRQAVRQRFRGGARPRAAAAERPSRRLPRDVPRAGRRSPAGPRRGRKGAAGLQGRSGHARRQFRLERACQDGAARGRPEQGAARSASMRRSWATRCRPCCRA